MSDKCSFMSTNCHEQIFSANSFGSTSHVEDKITPLKGGEAVTTESGGCDQETVVVGAAGKIRGGVEVVVASEESTSTEVEAAKPDVDWYTVEVSATHVNKPGGGRCPQGVDNNRRDYSTGDTFVH